ncbi:MAG: CHAP domain-containing protein [Thermacetogeniaceae bacterium]|jgi:hypothetical protein
MGQREDIIKIAQKEIGYKEGRNNDTKFGKWYGMNNNPWCAIFVSWCAKQANISQDIIPKMAYVPYMVSFYKNLKQYQPKGYRPQSGDIVFFGSSSHVGLVEACDGTSITTIEGNTSKSGNSSNGDGVYRRTRTIYDSWIMGYGVPKYKEEEVEIKQIDIKHSEKGVVKINSVNVNGENYIRLRDTEKIAPIAVGWDGKNPTVTVNYKE